MKTDRHILEMCSALLLVYYLIGPFFSPIGNNPLLNRRVSLEREAQKYLGVEYVWGGSTPQGFDCSGLVSYCAARQGLKIPRTAQDQFDKINTRTLSKEELTPGDLVYFYAPSGRFLDHIDHCGIFLGRGKIIHASKSSGKVTISPFRELSSRFAGGKRLAPS